MKELIDCDGEVYEMEWIEDLDFEKLVNVTQVYGFLFDEEGKFLIVNPGRSWRLPGGKPEFGETFEETLIRESIEEADVEIKDLIPLGFIKYVPKSENCNQKVFYQLRFIGKIKKINSQTIDVAEGLINERKFILPEEFENYIYWGKIGLFQLKAALEKRNNSENK